MTLLAATNLFPLSFLMIAVIDDLWFKKFHNWLFLSLSVLGFSYVLIFNSLPIFQALGGFVVGGLLMLPLVLKGVFGAGDMKFMMCFGILMGTINIFEVFLYALFWGAFIGVVQAFMAGKGRLLLGNLTGMAFKLKPVKTNKIPYTVAILFGWASFIQFGGFL